MVDRGSHEDAGQEPPDRGPCRVIETHISTLFFTPERVYKMLKRFGRDSSITPTRRVASRRSKREIVLNRRLARDVYLGSADLWEGEELVDRLIIMKRLPDDRRLSALASEPEFHEHLRAIARAVARSMPACPP